MVFTPGFTQVKIFWHWTNLILNFNQYSCFSQHSETTAMPSSMSSSRPLCKSLSDCTTLISTDVDKSGTAASTMKMTTDKASNSNDEFIPPWKKELLLRKSALARTVEPNLSL